MLALIAILLLVVCSHSVNSQVCQAETQHCGGIAQEKCCLGQQLTCVYEQPIHPEADGVCQRVCMTEGQSCGGFTLDPQVCCEGFQCVIRDARIPDLPGNCRAIV